MAKSKAAQQLADDLKALYEAADCSYEHIIGWGEEQRPKQAKFSKPSLNAWFNGRAVPSRPYDFRRLVELLESRAAKRRPGHRRRTPDEWERLREQAQAKRGAGTRTPVSSWSAPKDVSRAATRASRSSLRLTHHILTLRSWCITGSDGS